MAQTLTLKVKGLVTHPNRLSEAPEGGLVEATNIVVDRESQPEARRGYAKYGTALSGTVSAILSFKDTLHVLDGTTLKRDSDGAGTWTSYSGTISPPSSSYRVRSVQANQNLYLTTSSGAYKLDSVGGTVSTAGVPTGLDGSAALAAPAAGGWFTTANQVAYRIVWGIKDANNNVVKGAPSGRIEIANGSGVTKDVTLTFSIPSGITTSHFYQVYRSPLSGGVSTAASEEMQLVYEGNPTAGEITAKQVSYQDSMPTTVNAASIYTAPSQEGSLAENRQPPLCKDMCAFKGSMFYANTTTKHRLFLNLLGVGTAGNVLISGDTVTVAGAVYTAGAAENIATNTFKVSTAGTPADNLDDTSMSLVRVINQSTSNTSVYAFYLSGFSDFPGQLLIEERGIGGSSFTAASSRGSVWSPVLASAVTSTNETRKNRIYISKPGQPEAVPLLNYIDVGSADSEIKRIIALRTSVFAFKSEGIYRITGDDPSSFSAWLFDNTAHILAPESAAAFNNQIYCYSDQGIIAVSDSGVQVVSRDIEDITLKLSSSNNTTFAAQTVGVGYESERKYLVFTVTGSNDGYATQEYVYNSFTDSWTRWDLQASAAFVNPTDNKLYFANPVTGYIHQERKTFSKTDYIDDVAAVTIIGFSEYAVTLSDTTGLSAGGALTQSGTTARIVSVDGPNIVTVTSVESWSLAAAQVYKPISVAMQWVPQHCGNPATLKHFKSLVLEFMDTSFSTVTVGFTTDFSTSIETTDLAPVSDGGWGSFGWGTEPWGGGTPPVQAIRTYVPLEKRRGHWLNVRVTQQEAFATFGLGGFGLFYEQGSERMK